MQLNLNTVSRIQDWNARFFVGKVLVKDKYSRFSCLLNLSLIGFKLLKVTYLNIFELMLILARSVTPSPWGRGDVPG